MPTLIVQRGHCFRTSGATGTNGEQDFANRVAQECYRQFNGLNGWFVNPTLADENDYDATAFVSIHCDGSIYPSARGASAGYRTPEGQLFAHAWQRAYAARGWPVFRPDNYTPALEGYYGVRNAVAVGTRKAFIAECGFMTNPQDRALMLGAGGIERVALSIADALGITREEDDMSWDDLVKNPTTGAPAVDNGGNRYTRGTEAFYTNKYANTLPALDSRMTKVETKVNEMNTKLDQIISLISPSE